MSSAPPASADLLVYGGTVAGVAAAVATARAGQRVLLVEPSAHLGAMAAEGLGSSDIDNHAGFKNSAAVGGLAAEFYRRVAAAYGETEPRHHFEPHVAEAVLDAWLAEHADRVAILRRARLAEPFASAASFHPGTRRLAALRLEDGRVLSARAFIDATFEGDLLAAAGCTTTVGREAAATYGESLAGIRSVNTYRQFEVRVDPYVRPGEPAAGLLPGVQDEPLGEPGAADHRIQAYCFRLCLTSDPANRIPFAPPPGYRADDYELYRRYAAAGGRLWRPIPKLPKGKTDLGSWHDLSGNLYGLNHAYPLADYASRARILDEHLRFTQGLCHFLATDPALPADLRAEWARWGTCRDEFTDHGGWPRMFYVREARRLVSEHVVTERDCTGRVVADDPVAVAYWPPDCHHVRRIVRDGACYNEGFVFGGDIPWGPFGISRRALQPRAAECENLLAACSISSSHVGYGAIRLEWTFMALGQACAALARLAGAGPVQSVPYPELAAALESEGQILRLPSAS